MSAAGTALQAAGARIQRLETPAHTYAYSGPRVNVVLLRLGVDHGQRRVDGEILTALRQNAVAGLGAGRGNHQLDHARVALARRRRKDHAVRGHSLKSTRPQVDDDAHARRVWNSSAA